MGSNGEAVAPRRRSDRGIAATTARAIDATEDALGLIARITVEAIHCGLESSSHVEAAERDMRSALRQLVLTEREVRSRRALQDAIEAQRSAPVADLLPAPSADLDAEP